MEEEEEKSWEKKTRHVNHEIKGFEKKSETAATGELFVEGNFLGIRISKKKKKGGKRRARQGNDPGVDARLVLFGNDLVIEIKTETGERKKKRGKKKDAKTRHTDIESS